MQNRTSKFIVAMLTLMTIAFTVQIAVLYNEVTELRSQVDGHAEDVYVLMKSDGARLYTIMDQSALRYMKRLRKMAVNPQTTSW